MTRWTRASGWLLALVGLGLVAEAHAATAAQTKRPVRVLLLASAPSREYQLVKRLMTVAAEKKQLLLHFYLQPMPGSKKKRPVSSGDGNRALDSFPDHIGDPARDAAAKRPYNLNSYDVVIGFDPDWLQLSAAERERLHQWVEKGSGGLVLVAGPVNTGELGVAKNKKALEPIVSLYPVEPGAKSGKTGGSDRPHRLHFPAGKEPAFLKLEAKGEGRLAGWDEFFRGGRRSRKEPLNGFYDCFPIQAVKSGATVLATLDDPANRLPRGKEMPFLVTMPAGKGRVVYLGSGVWRLRAYREAFHDRFWTQLLSYAAGR